MGFDILTGSDIPDKKGMKRIQFTHEDGKNYTLNPLFYHDDIQRITNRNEQVISGQRVRIYFPLNGRYYGKTVKTKDTKGFSVRDLVKGVQQVGLRAIKKDMNAGRVQYKEEKPEHVLAQYGLFYLWVADDAVFAEVKKGKPKPQHKK